MEQTLPTDEAAAMIRREPGVIGNVRDSVLDFKKSEYKTFLVEHAIRGGDIIVHFFPPLTAYVTTPGSSTPVVSREFLRKWQQVFPSMLSPLAERYFNATKPTLTAGYVPEMTSWWMECCGFADRVNPDGFMRGFFEQLDASFS